MQRGRCQFSMKKQLCALILAAVFVPCYGQTNNEGPHLKRRHLGSKKEANNVFQRKGEKQEASYTRKAEKSRNEVGSSSVISKGSSTPKKSLKPTLDKAAKTAERQRAKASTSSLIDTLPVSVRSGMDLLSLLTDVNAGSSPLGNLCKLNDSGLFGDLTIAQAEGGKSYIVDFNYYTSITSGVGPFELRQEILPAVDRAVATAILPKFFPCVSQEPEASARNLQSGAIDALSSMPMDLFVPMKSGTCPDGLPDTDCYVARGALTVVAKDVFNIEALKSLVRVGVRTAFQSGGVMQNVETDLVKGVSFFDADPTSPVALQTSRPTTSPPLRPPAVDPTTYPVPTSAPARAVPVPNTGVPTTITTEPSSPLINLTVAPTGEEGEPSRAPQSADNTTEPEAPPIPQLEAEEKKHPLWWVWLLVGLGGVLLFVFLLTLCEEVDKSSGNQRSKKRSDDADERLGAAYIPPTEAAKAAAAHLRKHQNNYSAAAATTGENPGTCIMEIDDSDDEYKQEDEIEESFNDEGTYGMLEIVEEEVESSEEEEAGDDLMISYVEEEVSDTAGAWSNPNETSSYGSEY